MSAWIIQSLLRLRASYYFIPALMCLAAIMLGIVTTALDLAYQSEIENYLGWIFSSSVVSARGVLTTIAGSMISVAAVTFSLTMVAVTTAAAQYGPRLIGNFMRDRANQITLGMFLATFLYSIVVLTFIPGNTTLNNSETVSLSPNLSILIALLLTLISVAVLIFFIHHTPETLNIGNIVRKISKSVVKQIETGPFPCSKKFNRQDASSIINPFDAKKSHTVFNDVSGYIEAISLDGMINWAAENSYQIKLIARPGDYILKGDPLLELISDGPPHSYNEETLQSDISVKLRSFIAIGSERTAHQNLLFLAEELVEITARALSPGVNDPFTAINCIHWYGDICHTLMVQTDISPCLIDHEGKTRIWAKTIHSDDLFNTLFGQSRQYLCEDENAARNTLEMLYHLQSRADDRHTDIIAYHIKTLHKAIQQSSLSDSQKDRLKDRPPYHV